MLEIAPSASMLSADAEVEVDVDVDASAELDCGKNADTEVATTAEVEEDADTEVAKAAVVTAISVDNADAETLLIATASDVNADTIAGTDIVAELILDGVTVLSWRMLADGV